MSRVNMAICFLLKQEAKFFRNVFNRGMFAPKILKSFAPVVD